MADGHGEFLTTRDVMARYKVSRVTLWAWRRKGLLPAPLRLGSGPGTLRWKRVDLEAFEARKAA